MSNLSEDDLALLTENEREWLTMHEPRIQTLLTSLIAARRERNEALALKNDLADCLKATVSDMTTSLSQARQEIERKDAVIGAAWQLLYDGEYTATARNLLHDALTAQQEKKDAP